MERFLVEIVMAQEQKIMIARIMMTYANAVGAAVQDLRYVIQKNTKSDSRTYRAFYTCFLENLWTMF